MRFSHVAYYIAKNEKPYTDFPDLIALLMYVLDHCGTIACNRFIYDIHHEQIDQLITKL